MIFKVAAWDLAWTKFQVCDWKDFESDQFSAFYVGNLHFNATCFQVKNHAGISGCHKLPENQCKPFPFSIKWSKQRQLRVHLKVVPLLHCSSVLGLIYIN